MLREGNGVYGAHKCLNLSDPANRRFGGGSRWFQNVGRTPGQGNRHTNPRARCDRQRGDHDSARQQLPIRGKEQRGCPQRQRVVQDKALGPINETWLLLRWVQRSDFGSQADYQSSATQRNFTKTTNFTLDSTSSSSTCLVLLLGFILLLGLPAYSRTTHCLYGQPRCSLPPMCHVCFMRLSTPFSSAFGY